jgi:hypothetical protein
MEDLGLIIAIASCVMMPTLIVLLTKKKKRK